MTLVRAQPGWQSVDVLRHGMSEQAAWCPPMILICITPGTMSDAWRTVGTQVKLYIDDYALQAGVAVLESEVVRNSIYAVEKAAAIGASIALEDGAGTGTLGGFVQVEKDGVQPKLCAMTCHHVVVERGVSSPGKKI